MSCQVSKRKESKREKCQKKKEHNVRKANWRRVMMLSEWQIIRITITNCQSLKNALSQCLLFWLTSFSFYTIRYLSASMSDAFHPFSIAFNFTTLTVLSRTFECSIRSFRIFTRSVNAFCVSFMYIRVAFTLFFKPFRFIITSVICFWICCKGSACSWTYVLSLAVVFKIINTRALRKVISVTDDDAETFSVFENFSLVTWFFNWFIRCCLSVDKVWSSVLSAFCLDVLSCCDESEISTQMSCDEI